MPIAVIVLFVLSLSPIRFIQWTNWFAAQTQVIISPIAHPITIAMDMVIPPAISDPAASSRERAISDELDRVRTELLQTRNENHRLSTLVDELSRGAAITPNLNVRQVQRPRVSSLVGDLLLIRSGHIEGLTQGTVVVVDAVQLLGKVSRVDGKTAAVLPITAKSAPRIQATVLLDEAGTKQTICLLTPLGDGTLRGEVGRADVDESWSVQVGQEVRLLDNQWPRHAQMLVIGTVLRIERNDNQPLRQRIIVAPTIKDLRRVSDVIFRLPVLDDQPNNSRGDTP